MGWPFCRNERFLVVNSVWRDNVVSKRSKKLVQFTVILKFVNEWAEKVKYWLLDCSTMWNGRPGLVPGLAVVVDPSCHAWCRISHLFLHYFSKNMVNWHKTDIYRFGCANKLVAHHSHHNIPLSLFNYLLFTILHEFFIFSPNKTFLNLITFFPIFFTFFFFTTHYYYTLSPTPTKITSIPLIFTILVAKSTQFQTSLQIWVFNLTLPK